MTALAARVAAITRAEERNLERLAGGDLAEVLLLRRPDGHCTVAKSSPSVGAEATMLRAIGEAGVSVPAVEGEHESVLLLEYVENDGLFSPNAWADIGAKVRALHERRGERYGWPSDYALGTVTLHNRFSTDWPSFWGEQRLVATASVLDRPWRQRVERLVGRLPDLLPASPTPALLHGDLWPGNILVRDGRLAALIDPACCFGHAEADLAMLKLFGATSDAFWQAYGALEPGWEQRLPVYQLLPLLLHLRLFGRSYASATQRILDSLGA